MNRLTAKRRLFSLASILVGLGLTSQIVRANTVQDQQGVGSRVKAMGGAGTALAEDSAATYYNPASLSQCAQNQVQIETSYWHYGLTVDSPSESYEGESLSDRSAVTLSGCLHLPYKLSAGFLFDTGLSHVQRLQQTSLSTTPEFALYGKPLEQISMQGGIAFQVNKKLSLGIGGAVLVNSGLQIGAEVPILADEGEINGSVAWTLKPAASFYGGARYQVNEKLVLAAAIRTALFHQLEAQARTRVQAAGVLIDVDLLLENVAWYSPLQASIGTSYQLSHTITAAFDLSWYHYSAHPGPNIHVSPLDPDNSVAAGLNYPPDEPPNFHDIFVPRFGLEYLPSTELALRAGLSYRPSPAPLPSPDRRSSLLDAAVASLSLGAGYSWQFVSTGEKSTLSNFELSAHLRAHHMSEQSVRKVINTNESESFKFGGQMLDAGITATLGW